MRMIVFYESENKRSSLHVLFYCFFLMFTFPSKGDTLDFFSLCQVSSFSLRCPFVGFAFSLYPWQCIHRRALLCATPTGVSPINLSLPRAKKHECQQTTTTTSSRVSFSEESKRKQTNKQTKKGCKNVVNVWFKVSLAGLHISDSFVYQRNTNCIEEKEERFLLYCT